MNYCEFGGKKGQPYRSVEVKEESCEESREENYDHSQKKEEEMVYEKLMANLGVFNLKIEQVKEEKKSKTGLLNSLQRGVNINEIMKMVNLN